MMQLSPCVRLTVFHVGLLDNLKQAESPPSPMWNRVTIFEGAGMVDEGCLGNNESGLPVEWYGSLKNLSKNNLKRGGY